jgi:hypothetical protein
MKQLESENVALTAAAAESGASLAAVTASASNATAEAADGNHALAESQVCLCVCVCVCVSVCVRVFDCAISSGFTLSCLRPHFVGATTLNESHREVQSSSLLPFHCIVYSPLPPSLTHHSL